MKFWKQDRGICSGFKRENTQIKYLFLSIRFWSVVEDCYGCVSHSGADKEMIPANADLNLWSGLNKKQTQQQRNNTKVFFIYYFKSQWVTEETCETASQLLCS